MRHFLLTISIVVVAGCESRAGTDRTTTDMGPTSDLGVADGSSTDTGATDASSTTDATVGDAGADAAEHDAGFDAGGEPCGTSVCTTGSYCCAPACNLCLSDSMFCLTDPCAGIDAGPPPVDGGAAHDAGHDGGGTGTCGGVTCPPTDHCGLCGSSYVCLMPGVTCVPPPSP